jgi:hypothetical protein
MRDQSPGGVQPSGCPHLVQLPTARNILGKPPARTDGYLDACPQPLGKHRWLICKDPDACSHFSLQESRRGPVSVPNGIPRATFWAIKLSVAAKPHRRVGSHFIANPSSSRRSQASSLCAARRISPLRSRSRPTNIFTHVTGQSDSSRSRPECFPFEGES